MERSKHRLEQLTVGIRTRRRNDCLGVQIVVTQIENFDVESRRHVNSGTQCPCRSLCVRLDTSPEDLLRGKFSCVRGKRETKRGRRTDLGTMVVYRWDLRDGGLKISFLFV